MATYLVTGAAGFIASEVCLRLLESGHTVVGIDNLNDYYDVRVKEYRLSRLLGDVLWLSNTRPDRSVYERGRCYRNKQFQFQVVDIEDRSTLETVFAEHKFDAVLNLAARAGVRASMENPYVFLSTNTTGTLNILECQKKFSVKKQVLASTSSLYAGNSMPFREDLPVNTPLSPYAAAKKAAELMAYSYHRLYGLDISVLRYFTVVGPAGRPDMALFRFVKSIDEGTPIVVYGDGSQTRDFTYVGDIATGTIAAIQECGYEIINLGGGRRPVCLKDIISRIESILGRTAIVERAPFHKADMRETCADISKAWELLRWAPEVDAMEAVRRCVEWHEANRSWLRGVRV